MKRNVNNFLTKISYKRTQNVTLTEVIPLRKAMYSCSQQNIHFWNRHNAPLAVPMSAKQLLDRPDYSCTQRLGSSGIKLPEYIYTDGTYRNNFTCPNNMGSLRSESDLSKWHILLKVQSYRYGPAQGKKGNNTSPQKYNIYIYTQIFSGPQIF
jgi:hypothetical protein